LDGILLVVDDPSELEDFLLILLGDLSRKFLVLVGDLLLNQELRDAEKQLWVT